MWLCRGTELTSKALMSPCHTHCCQVSAVARESPSVREMPLRPPAGLCGKGCWADTVKVLQLTVRLICWLACYARHLTCPAPSKTGQASGKGAHGLVCCRHVHVSVQVRGRRTSSRATRLRTALMSLRGSLAAIFSDLQSGSWLQAGPAHSTVGSRTPEQVRLFVRALDSQYGCQVLQWQSSRAVSLPDMGCIFSLVATGMPA